MPRSENLHGGTSSWLPHLIFYSLQIFLALVAGVIIFTDADPRIAMRKLQEDTNILGDNPGLSFRPMGVNQDSGKPNSMISYRVSNRESYTPWVNSLENFLEAYRVPGLTFGRGQNIYNCDYNHPPAPGHVCDVDVKRFAQCVPENYFSYHRGSPCVFLKLNTPPGWFPIFYNDTNSLPDDMPENLKSYIINLGRTNRPQLNTIWVSCEGENAADIEFIGPIDFQPMPGFPGYYFMDTNIEGYLSPLVAIQFKKPSFGALINVKCKAWARNIKHDNNTALGGVQFELMLD